VALLRVVAGSLLLGQFLAPGFFLSLSGALASLAVLAAAARLPPARFGSLGQHTGGFAHVAAALARLWLVPHFYLAPLFAASWFCTEAARLLKETP
jgi:heptaprenyl diphosphate synthase